MRRAGYTAAPCPGCGRDGGEDCRGNKHAFRPTDSVCHDCAKLIEEALAARERAKQEHEYRLYLVTTERFYDGRSLEGLRDYFYGGDQEPDFEKHHLDEILAAMFRRIAKGLAKDLPRADAPDSAKEGLLFETGREYGSQGVQGDWVWLRPQDAENLRAARKAICLLLKDRTRAGEEYGRGLLAQLATGELSVQKFNQLSNPDKKDR